MVKRSGHHKMCRVKRGLCVAVGFAALVAALSWALPPAWAAPEVTGARIGTYPAATRVVLDLSERIRYRIFSLCRPARVVIELPQVGWRPSIGVPLEGRGLVRALRFGTPSPGRSRVVLDVAEGTKMVRTFMLRPQGAEAG